MPEVARVAVSSTIASSIREHGQYRAHDDVEQDVAGSRHQQGPDRGGFGERARGLHDEVKRERDEPSPISTRRCRPASCPAGLRRSPRQPKINNGDSHDRSKENTPPSCCCHVGTEHSTASAAAVVTMPLPTKDGR